MDLRLDRLARNLRDEALRLFFPLAAGHAALWPLAWVLVHRLDLPLAQAVPPAFWHAHEMLTGAFGAALIGFLLTAPAEWTRQPRPRGRILFAVAGLWAVGRLVGLVGGDALALIAAVADVTWMGGLVVYLAVTAWRARSWELRGFLAWVAVLWISEASVWFGFLTGDLAFARDALFGALLAFAGLLALALARITPPITNRVLDPTGARTPFRPHPARRNLAPALIAVAGVALAAGASMAVQGYLLIAAGAACLDRSAEAFVGKAFFRAEILALGGAAALAGAGLILIGASRIGLPLPELAGVHLLSMGGLGLAVLAVLVLAGRLHTGRPLGLGPLEKSAFALLLGATFARVLAALMIFPDQTGQLHALAAAAWAGAFLLWLVVHWPWLAAEG